MPELVASKRLTYATRRLSPGDTFTARTERHARVLVAIKKARRVGSEANAKSVTPEDDIKALREKYAEVTRSTTGRFSKITRSKEPTMTVTLKDANGNLRGLPTAKVKLPIDMTGCGLIFLPGADPTRPYRNWVDGSNLSIFGDPTEDDSSVTFGGDGISFAQTAVADSAEITLFTVAAPTLDLNAAFISNWGSATSNGGASPTSTALWANHDVNSDNLYKPASTISPFSGAATSIYKTTGVATVTPRAIALRHSVTSGLQSLNDLTAGLEQLNSGRTTRSLGQAFRLGAGYSTVFPNPAREWAAIIFQRYLSNTELADLYAWAKELCADLATPITV